MIRPDRLVDEVHPGLWIGGSWAPFPSDTKPFDIVLTVCSSFEATHPAPVRVREFTLRLNDMAHVNEEAVHTLSDAVTTALGKGLTVLVRCAWGLNRSALVAGAALTQITDLTGVQIAELMRTKRSPDVLFNRTFARYLTQLAPALTPTAEAEAMPDAAPQYGWRGWKITEDANGPALAPPLQGRQRVARGGVFMASCELGCATPPQSGCLCGIYVMPNADGINAWLGVSKIDLAVGRVRLHGRVVPGNPNWIGAFPGEYRAAGVSLHEMQWLPPKLAHLVKPLSERYGVPFEVREGWDMPTIKHLLGDPRNEVAA